MINNNSSSVFGAGSSSNPIDSVKSGFVDNNICGKGGACVVYQMCLDGLHVAVKRLNRVYVSHGGYAASYRKEFLIGQRLKHDALPVYRDLYIGFDDVYLVMDYVDGISVGDFIKSKEGQEYFSSKENIMRFLKELLNVVTYLHRSGVIHSDLKPANIMLRHSDRSVMLIDFDKAYSDILDGTHGGTPSISDAIKTTDKKPTSFKDFSAIGNVIDIIAKNVPNFPTRNFRRFREECLNKKTNINRLVVTLEHNPYSKMNKVSGILITLIAMFLVLHRNLNTPDNAEDSNKILYKEEHDTIANVLHSVSQPKIEDAVGLTSIQYPSPPSTTSEKPVKSEGLIVDIDTPMAEFTSKVEKACSCLTTGISKKQLRDLQYDLELSRSPLYQGVIKDMKLRYPDMSGIDVELVVARAYERSRAGMLYIKFNEAVSDTLRQWEQRDKSDNDLQ